MKMRTIWIIVGIMGLSFLALLFLQLNYIQEMADMKREQFDESVNRALYQAARNMELNETLHYLEKDINESDSLINKENNERDNKRKNEKVNRNQNDKYSQKSVLSFELKTLQSKPSQTPKAMILKTDRNSLSEASKSMQEIVRNRYVYQKALLDEVVYTMLYSASDRPLKERINFKLLDQDLKSELLNNGINIPYHFIVTTSDGRVVHRCEDYTDDGVEYSYSQTLFRNDPVSKMGTVRVHFPDMNRYIYSSVRFMIPSVIFTLVLLITFIFTIIVVFRQKKYSEMRNDFINNMTHELKTPIASISLAGQMLKDRTIDKAVDRVVELGGKITADAKRLLFLVEKVLQMSMFDKDDSILKPKRLDLNEMVETIAESFTLRVEHTGGHIYIEIEAINSEIDVDELHFQNVIFNLMDNAVKYRKPEQPIDIHLHTWDDEEHLYLAIKDTGVGIKKENVKRIFDRFYRVHTGNVHNVKGFGLGLAYVKRVVELHKGEISIDSDFGKGTTFTIKLPIIKE